MFSFSFINVRFFNVSLPFVRVVFLKRSFIGGNIPLSHHRRDDDEKVI